MGNAYPRYKRGDRVKALVLQHTEFGYKTVVDNLFLGLIYENQVYKNLTVGETIMAYVNKVREDNKIDLNVSSREDVELVAEDIMKYVENPRRRPTEVVDDSMSPELVKELFGCSKRIYKQALGHLYKTGRLTKYSKE